MDMPKDLHILYRIRKLGAIRLDACRYALGTYQIIWVRIQSLYMLEILVGYLYGIIGYVFLENSLNSVLESQKVYEDASLLIDSIE